MLESHFLDLFWFEDATTCLNRWGHQVQHVRSDGSPEQHVAGSGGLEVRGYILPLENMAPQRDACKDVCLDHVVWNSHGPVQQATMFNPRFLKTGILMDTIQ